MTELGRRPIKKLWKNSEQTCVREKEIWWDKLGQVVGQPSRLSLEEWEDEGKERENRKGEKEMRDINCTGVSIKGKSQQDTTHRDGRTRKRQQRVYQLPTIWHLWVCAALMLQKVHIQIFKRFDKNNHIVWYHFIDKQTYALRNVHKIQLQSLNKPWTSV